MAVFSKLLLSANATGVPVVVVATAIGTGTTIHTAHATALDEIWLWAVNTDTTAHKLTLGWGGTTDPDNLVEFTVPAEDGLYAIAPGLLLTGGLIVKAAAASASKILLLGFVNRIT